MAHLRQTSALARYSFLVFIVFLPSGLVIDATFPLGNIPSSNAGHFTRACLRFCDMFDRIAVLFASSPLTLVRCELYLRRPPFFSAFNPKGRTDAL